MKLNPVSRSSRFIIWLSSPHARISSFQFHETDNSHQQQPKKPHSLPFSRKPNVTTTIPIMASDEAYTSFLEKANQPTGANTSTVKPNTQNQQDLTSQPSDIPDVLKSFDVTFTSESDEPFEPFAVPYSGSSLPNASEFARAIKHEKGEGGVEDVSVGDFDPRGEYKIVIEAVEAAGAGDGKGKGEVKCFRADAGKSTKLFYYIVGLDREGRRLVGVRAVSVES